MAALSFVSYRKGAVGQEEETMNYDEARQTHDLKGWHWTTKNDGRIRTAEPCVKHIGDESDPQWYVKPFNRADWEYCEPHPTREDAERHFYDYCLEQVTEGTSTNWMGCRKCDTPTKNLLGNRGMHLLFNSEPLCDNHRTKEMLAELHPFAPGITLMHS